MSGWNPEQWGPEALWLWLCVGGLWSLGYGLYMLSVTHKRSSWTVVTGTLVEIGAVNVHERDFLSQAGGTEDIYDYSIDYVFEFNTDGGSRRHQSSKKWNDVGKGFRGYVKWVDDHPIGMTFPVYCDSNNPESVATYRSDISGSVGLILVGIYLIFEGISLFAFGLAWYSHVLAVVILVTAWIVAGVYLGFQDSKNPFD